MAGGAANASNDRSTNGARADSNRNTERVHSPIATTLTPAASAATVRGRSNTDAGCRTANDTFGTDNPVARKPAARKDKHQALRSQPETPLRNITRNHKAIPPRRDGRNLCRPRTIGHSSDTRSLSRTNNSTRTRVPLRARPEHHQ